MDVEVNSKAELNNSCLEKEPKKDLKKKKKKRGELKHIPVIHRQELHNHHEANCRGSF